MTVIEYEYYQCAVCGAVSYHRSVVSSYHYGKRGWSDLDFRPPQEFRIYGHDFDGFQICPKCGYIAENIEEEVSHDIKSFVLSDEYKKLQSDSSTKEYLSLLLALSQKKSDYNTMFYAARHLAWICDDSIRDLGTTITNSLENNVPNEKIDTLIEQQKQARDNALLYRRKALDILENHDDALTSDADIQSCIIADFHRRCGDFEKVIQFCKETGSEKEDIRSILRYEIYLSSQKDSGRHHIGQAKSYAAEHPEEEGFSVPKKGKSWTCPYCGSEGNTSRICPGCGTESWTCPVCHHKWNTGETCDNCKSPKPVENSVEIKRWSCPECHHGKNTGKICRHCGKPTKPELQTWDCPSCGQKGNTEEKCSKCGFSYWDIYDPEVLLWKL